ncbi:MAG: ComEC/Rec2 family competence protein, partial [Woeseiaceae bacterium]
MRRARASACLACGFVLFQLAGAHIVDARLEPAYEGDSMLTAVRIIDFPEQSRGSVVMLAEPLDDHRIPSRIRISWFEPAVEPRLGEVWEFELRLRRPRGNLNPGGFDYESWLFREKIHAAGYVVAGKRNRLLWAGDTTAIDQFRARFLGRTAAATPAPGRAAVLTAIGAGARHGISRTQWDRFAETGTSHLMAISGLHVGLAAMAGFLIAFPLLALLRVAHNHYVAAVLPGAMVAGAYALVSGFGVPARRAVLMLPFAALAVIRRRQLAPATIVAQTAALVFVFDPVASLAPGFHLSFGAVVLLLWLGCRRSIARVTGPAWLFVVLPLMWV